MEPTNWSIRINKATEDTLSIDFRPGISNAHEKTFDLPWRASSTLALKGIGDPGTILVTFLSAIEGLERIAISKYRVRLYKAPLYSWEELFQQIKSSIKRATNCTDEQVDCHPSHSFKEIKA